jgi:hypothetical protein
VTRLPLTFLLVVIVIIVQQPPPAPRRHLHRVAQRVNDENGGGAGAKEKLNDGGMAAESR